MTHQHSTVAVFDAHAQAEAAVRRLGQAGYPIDRLSIIGRGYETEEQVVGFYNLGDRVRLWGKNGAVWGGLWGLFATGVFMTTPVLGPLLVLGHIGAMVVGALEGAALAGGLGVLGGALASIGVPKDSVLRYEEALRADKFLVVVHGTPEDAKRAQDLLADANAVSVETYVGAAESVAVKSPDGGAHAGHHTG